MIPKKDTPECYDVSPKERSVIEWKHLRRQELRNEYLKLAHHPTKHAMPIDEGIHRFTTMKLTYEYNPSTRLGRNFCLCLLAVCGGLLYIKLGGRQRDQMEHKYRTGQVAYVDRYWKFQ